MDSLNLSISDLDILIREALASDNTEIAKILVAEKNRIVEELFNRLIPPPPPTSKL